MVHDGSVVDLGNLVVDIAGIFIQDVDILGYTWIVNIEYLPRKQVQHGHQPAPIVHAIYATRQAYHESK